jgi:hypothetical protein
MAAGEADRRADAVGEERDHDSGQRAAQLPRCWDGRIEKGKNPVFRGIRRAGRNHLNADDRENLENSRAAG